MKKSMYLLLAGILILLFAASFRIHTFYLPHNHGDQLFYLGLAMKLKHAGLSDYNLKSIDIGQDKDILAVLPARAGSKGRMLESLEKGNVFYYSNESLSNMPPGYSYLLMLSHEIFCRGRMFITVTNNLGPLAIIFRPKLFLDAQFYAVWINFIFSLLFIVVIFILGRTFFNEKVGLWAAFLMATSPLDILTSQRLWSDEMVSLFMAICVLLYWTGKKRDDLWIIFASGLSAGLASLSKSSGLFVIVIIVIWEMLCKARERKSALKLLIDRKLAVFFLSSIAVASIWYYRVTLVYGVPWYSPHQNGIEKVSMWFLMLKQRPWYGQLYYFVWLTPLFILFYFELAKTILRKMFTQERMLLLVWVFAFIGIFIAIGAKEERYLLPAYPAIAIFTGLALEDIRETLNRPRYLGTIIIMICLCISALWSIDLGLSCVFNNYAIFDLF